MKNIKIITYFKTFKTENFKNKYKLNMGMSSSLVYEFNCEKCHARYIGERHKQKHKQDSKNKFEEIHHPE